MKYIIDVPEEIAEISEEFLSKAGLLCEPYTEPDRKAIEDEVWEFLDFLVAEMDTDDRYECFHASTAYKIVHSMSYQEAKAKYEAWLKQKDEIKVGDEVKHIDGYGKVVTVIRNSYEGRFDAMDNEGNVYLDRDTKNWVKTGRHFPEVAELLEKMRGEE